MSKGTMEGKIYKALSGFYYVSDGSKNLIECRARGKFRLDGTSPLVGDIVKYTQTEEGKGMVDEIKPRKNSFIRPPISNIDVMIIVAAEVNPVSDPFLIDRITVVAEHSLCDCIICINKADKSDSRRLYDIYKTTGYKTIFTSSKTNQGIDELLDAIKGKTCSFVGNSGVGKSSLLNAVKPEFDIQTAEVSQKLGRGKHTTRHVELYTLDNGALIADTPGFSSFDTERMNIINKTELECYFREFQPFLGKCEFNDCSHTTEKGCAVLKAVNDGGIHKTRHESFIRLYENAKQIKEWEINKRQ